MSTFLEAHVCDLAEASLDPEARLIRNVILIRSGESRNKRMYSDEVLQKAAGVFEGVRAYADHPSPQDIKQRRERSIREITGWYTNVHYENGALRGDRHFSRTQAGMDALAIAEDILSGRAPASLAGLSINAVGEAQPREDGGLIVASITAAYSVDDVTTPAAGGTYLAASSGEDVVSALLQTLTFDEWFSARPEYVQRVQREMKTVRQEKALTEAQALAEQLQALVALEQAKNQELQAMHEAARAELAQVRRMLAINEALAKVQLPAAWLDALRAELAQSEPEAWESIISREKSKAQAVRPGVTVRGAGQRVQPIQPMVEIEAPKAPSAASQVPLPEEDVQAWARRVNR